MPKIKFTKDYQVKGTTWVRARQNRKPLQGYEEDSPKYSVGDVIDATPDQVRKFTNRGVAVELTAPVKAAARPAIIEAKIETKPEDRPAAK